MADTPDWIERLQKGFRRNRFGGSIVLLVLVVGVLAYFLTSVVSIRDAASTIKSWFQPTDSVSSEHNRVQDTLDIEPQEEGSIRIGVFPFLNQSKPNLSDADLDRIVGLLESELISCNEVSVIERDRIKEIWSERQKAETFPDIYDSTQFMKYMRVFQVRYGLIGKGFLSERKEIVIIAKIVDGETAKIVASASGAIPPRASYAEEKAVVARIVEEILTHLGYRNNRVPEKKYAIMFLSQPAGAEIHINGENTQHVTDTRIFLDKGTYNIDFVKDGYRTEKNTIHVPQNRQVIAILKSE